MYNVHVSTKTKIYCQLVYLVWLNLSNSSLSMAHIIRKFVQFSKITFYRFMRTIHCYYLGHHHQNDVSVIVWIIRNITGISIVWMLWIRIGIEITNEYGIFNVIAMPKNSNISMSSDYEPKSNPLIPLGIEF